MNHTVYEDSDIILSNPTFVGLNRHTVLIQGAIIAFSAIAWYNSAELVFMTLKIFKRYAGLYFWSMIITAIAIVPYSFATWAYDSHVFASSIGIVTVALVGWMVMVTGQSVVLYSRLHLIHDSRRTMKILLVMIISNSIILFPPTAFFTYASQTDLPIPYAGGYLAVVKLQLCVFTAQEFVISGFYLYDVYKLMTILSEPWKRSLMWELVAINVIIIVVDTLLLGVQFENLNSLENSLKGFVYSIKLKLEFEVLSKLVAVAKENGNGSLADGAMTNLKTQEDPEPTPPPAEPQALHLAIPRPRPRPARLMSSEEAVKRATMFPNMLENALLATHEHETPTQNTHHHRHHHNRKTVAFGAPISPIGRIPESSTNLPPLSFSSSSLMSPIAMENLFRRSPIRNDPTAP